MIFERPIPFAPEKVDNIVRRCCVLHNWLRLRKGNGFLTPASIDVEDLENGNIISGSWRKIQSKGMLSLTRNSANHSCLAAGQFREKIVDYSLGRGAVPWQFKMIH